MPRTRLLRPNPRAVTSASMVNPAGHQTTRATAADSSATTADWAIRTPLPRSSEATWYTSPSIRSSSSPTGVDSKLGRSCPKATRHNRRRTSADQSAVSPAAINPTLTSQPTVTTSAIESNR